MSSTPTTGAPERTRSTASRRSTSIAGAVAILFLALGPAGAAFASPPDVVVSPDAVGVDAGGDPAAPVTDGDSTTPTPDGTTGSAGSAPADTPATDPAPVPSETGGTGVAAPQVADSGRPRGGGSSGLSLRRPRARAQRPTP